MNKPTVLTLALFGLFSLCKPAWADDARAEALLQKAKEATGGKAWDGVKTLSEKGRLQLPQLQGSYIQHVDLARQRNHFHYDLGVIKGASGFDGKEAWSADATGQTQALTAGDDKAEAVSSLYRDSLAYWFPDRMKAERSYAGERSADGVVYDAVRIAPQGGLPFELWISRSNQRIERYVALHGAQPTMDRYSDFHQVSGVSLPFKISSVYVKSGKEAQQLALDSAEVNVDLPDSTFSRPAPPAADFAFASGQHSVTLPFHLDANHIMVTLDVDQGAPLNMIFDTGALNLIDRKLADGRGYRSEGAVQGGGFGKETVSFGFTKVPRMRLGALTLTQQPFVTMDLARLNRAAGEPFDGLIGYEVAKRTVVRIDYPASKLSLIEQGHFVPSAGAIRLPLKFADRTPIVEAKINGVPGEFQLDTGSRSGVWLTDGFAKAHPQLAKASWSAPFVDGFGVGGPTVVSQSRLDTLELGPIKLRQLRVTRAAEADGNEGAGHTAGNIGGALLKHFVVTLDYANSCIYLEPAAASFSDAGDYDRSGMFLLRAEQGEGFEVLDVAKGSAAALAGVLSGERLVALAGQPLADLGRLRAQLMGPVGSRIELTVQDAAGKRRSVALVLAERG
ncbi:aspartyl protease family protein [Chitinimonas sp.]|uniref:aspartyl protease family protein n=1 Tax=Chitinimonas sp. TaxID=1934313 RepID=UPI0035B25707